MVLLILILFGLVLFLFFRLMLFKKQLREFTGQLQDFSPDSNQRLTCFLRDREHLALCSQINRSMDVLQQAVLTAEEAEKDLKYTMSCVSHDIHTPLTGAAGYMQLLERTQDPDKREKYCRIVRQKLEDLETLLEELFLYTRLTGNEFPIEMKKIQLFPVLCDALAGFYPHFQAQNRAPSISFEQENAEIQADPAQLRRVLRNLISNALTHGQGTLFIYQKGNTLSFVNETKTWETVHPKLLFERFYRTDQARQGNHAGLGLSISRELMLKMQGNICAESKDGRLWITLTFAKEKTGV